MKIIYTIIITNRFLLKIVFNYNEFYTMPGMFVLPR